MTVVDFDGKKSTVKLLNFEHRAFINLLDNYKHLK